MATRLELQAALEAVLGTDKVYFEPPESLKLTYPCIVYKLEPADIIRADNKSYRYTRKYTVTYISHKSTDSIVDVIPQTFQMCEPDRHFVSAGLNHYVYTLYF